MLARRNTSFDAGVEFADARKGLPVESGTVDCVFASHVLEHLALADCQLAIAECYRILRPGGLFRAIVPDMEALARRYLDKRAAGVDRACSEFMESTFLGLADSQRDLGARLRVLFGGSRHLWMWDEASLARELAEVGFTEIRRAAWGDSVVPDVGLVEREERFVDAVALEAIKPVRALGRFSAGAVSAGATIA